VTFRALLQAEAVYEPIERAHNERRRVGGIASRGVKATQARPSIAAKCASNDNSPAPVPIAWAAIQMSFVGIGLPRARRAAAIRANRSAVVSMTGTRLTYG
jgi:hypothetical protein